MADEQRAASRPDALDEDAATARDGRTARDPRAEVLGAGGLEVLVLDAQLRVREWSSGAGELLGPGATRAGGPVEAGARPWNDATFEADLRNVLTNGGRVERVLRTPDGRSLLATLEPLLDGSGERAGVVVALMAADAPARREWPVTEDMWRELDELVSAASHDLREPLRTIRGFCQVLKQRSADRLDEEGRFCLERIEAATTRMRVVLEGFSRLARVFAQPPKHERVELDAVVRDVLAALQEVVTACGATVACGPLPTILGSEALLRELWQSLLENALAHRGDAPPRVTITAERCSAGWQFAVADNGIGIPAEHQGRVFEAFRRLDPARCPDRAGVGLTIAKVAVERHGGRIWVESTPGLGTTFRFTLPTPEAAGG